MKIPTRKLSLFTKRSSQGFTLVGVLIAVIIAAEIVVIVTRLMARSEIVLDVSRETAVAAGLAREGLELTRAVRDRNWFTQESKEQWLEGLCLDEESSREFTLDTEMVRLEQVVGSGASGQLFIHPNGLWEHSAPADSTSTPYERVITLDCSTADDELPHVTVTSTVTWQGRQAQERSVVLKEKLYNWIPEG